jgi:hypothetical protein
MDGYYQDNFGNIFHMRWPYAWAWHENDWVDLGHIQEWSNTNSIITLYIRCLYTDTLGTFLWDCLRRMHMSYQYNADNGIADISITIDNLVAVDATDTYRLMKTMGVYY